MQYGLIMQGSMPVSTMDWGGKVTTRWEDHTVALSVELPVKRDPRLDDPGVMEWLHRLQRTLAIRNQLEAEGKPSMKSAVEQVIMVEFGIDHADAHRIMNVIEIRNLLRPADVAKAYKIKMD